MIATWLETGRPVLAAGVAQRIVTAALDEDVGPGDVTTEAIVDPHTRMKALLRTRADGIVSGVHVAAMAFHIVDPTVEFDVLIEDCARCRAGEPIAEIRGLARGILTAERVSLNLLQRMSGIATTTDQFVEAVRHTDARILDTRKTVPGLRVLDKYAVRCGGGHNHRFGLFDGVLIKDNHIAAHGGDVQSAVRQARASAPHTLRIEVEVDRLDQILPALEAGAEIILLDNMTADSLREAVSIVNGQALTEASGGIGLNSVARVAEAGVDFISVGSLTHSVVSLDVGLDFDS